IDWTHEREWRWPYTGSLAEFEAELAEYGIVDAVKDIPGLDLYAADLRGIGVIVNSPNEARMITHDVLTLVDRQLIQPDTFEYILVAHEIRTPASIRDPDEEEQAIARATIDFSTILAPQPTRDDQILSRIQIIAQEIEAHAGQPQSGEWGGC